MSKSDNLTDFLTDIADTIRAKKGTTELINPQNFSTEIENMSSENKLPQLIDRTITEITEDDLKDITQIGDYAFAGCKKLSSAFIIPDNITRIGNAAFKDCEKLTSIFIPKSVTYIGNMTFDSCTGLKEVHISDLVAWCNIYFYLSYQSNPINYAKSLYLNDELLTELTPQNLEGATSIGGYAFYNCRSLTRIVIPDSVTKIGEKAFESCTQLTSVSLPNTITEISYRLFINCNSLTSITIPSIVTKIDSGALHIGSAINKGTITMLPTTPPTISSDTFKKNFLNKIIVPVGTGDTYKAATNWATFADYIEEATV